MRRLGSLLMVLAILAGPASTQAQMFRWTDERGRVYYSEGLDSVPERFRPTAKPLLYPTAPPPSEPLKPAARPGITKIPFKPGSPIVVNAKVNGGGPVALMLDTGADTSVIAPLALWRLGISTWFAPRADVRGATGTTRADVVQVQSIEVGDAKAGPLVVIAHDIEFQNADGLLGRDFLNHFNVNIDTTAGMVILSPR